MLILAIVRSVSELAKARPLTANQLTAKTWENLVRRSCPFFTLTGIQDFSGDWEEGFTDWVEERLSEEEINISLLAKILSKMDNRQAPLLLLLHVISERFVPVVYRPEDKDYPMAFHLRCPCRKIHAVNHIGFLLLEKVEDALESAEQELDKVSLGRGDLEEPWLSALVARLVRQRSSVREIKATSFWFRAENDLEKLLSLQQNCLRLTLTELCWDAEKEGHTRVVRDEEFWTKLAREIKLESLGVHTVFAYRSDLIKARRDDLRALWDGLVVDENGFSSFSALYLPSNSDIYEDLNFKWLSEEEKEMEWLLFKTALDKPPAEWPEDLTKKWLEDGEQESYDSSSS